MGRWRSCGVALALAGAGALVTSCAGKSTMHWQGGDAFSVFEAEGHAPSPLDCPGTTQARFNCFATKVRERVGETSVVLAIDADGGALLETATTEPDQAVPTTADTLFPLLSVTKMFTAATAVLLAQDGTLDLHRAISHDLPELDGSPLGRVTLHHLLSHTAGLVDDPFHAQCEGGGVLSDAPTRAHVGAAPGTAFLYSNIGFSLAGLIIERATSRPFEDVVRQRVLLPMGMKAATFDFSRVSVVGHPAPGKVRCRLAAPSGGLIASARDMARWARAMSEPATHPLGQPLVAALTTPHIETGARPDEAYGYGVWMMKQGEVWVYQHSGLGSNFSAFVAWVPARHLGAAAMMNAKDAAGAMPQSIVLRGLSALLDLPADFRAHVEGSPRPFAAYVGTYVDPKSWLGRVRVRTAGKRLAFDYLDGPPPLLPPNFTFRFLPGEERARFVVTVMGIAERVADERGPL